MSQIQGNKENWQLEGNAKNQNQLRYEGEIVIKPNQVSQRCWSEAKQNFNRNWKN
jgi:hypothetical protein